MAEHVKGRTANNTALLTCSEPAGNVCRKLLQRDAADDLIAARSVGVQPA